MSNNYYPYNDQQGQLYGNQTGFQQPQGQPSYQQQPPISSYGDPNQQQQQVFSGANQPGSFNYSSQSTQLPSFIEGNPSSRAGGAPSYATDIDQLSFLTPQDQQKFKDLFNSATNSVSISPDNARGILIKSNLNPHQLARIWDLSDLNKSGDLLFPEFALALHLCNVALRGNELPYVLEPRIKEEVTNLVDKISFSIPEEDPTNSQPDRPAPQPNISASSIFTQPQQQQSATSNLAPQATGFGFGNSGTNYPAGFQSQAPQQTGFQTQATGFQSNAQETGFQSNGAQNNEFSAFQSNQGTSFPSLAPQQQRTGIETQNTGFPFSGQTSNHQTQQPPPISSLQQQPTGFTQSSSTGLAQQPTGLVPLKVQATGTQPLQQQPTGLVPLQGQNTGGQPLKQQPTGLVPLQGQNTGGQPLKQQQTGLIPLQGQNTGGHPLKQQPTGLIPLQNQQTGNIAPQLNQQTALQQQQTGHFQKKQETGTQVLTQQPTGLVPLAATATGSVALQTQLTGPAPLHSQRTGFGNFEPLRQQKTGVGQNSLFLQNLLQPPPPLQQQQQQHTLFNSNSLNYTTETITPQEKQLFNKIFENYDTNRKGLLTADVSAEIFRKSGLNRSELEKVWDLVTRPNQTHLDKESFQMGMWLVYKRLNGFELPDALPESLKPSSIKILDDVKTQLKINPNAKSMKKSSSSRIDGSRFKNNDDALIMSSSRNRRRANNKSDSLSSGANLKPKEILSIDEIKKRIREKKILLDAFEATGSEYEEKEIDYEKEDLEAIARLKEEIKNLPNISNTNNDERPQLKKKFNELTSKVPALINEIAQVDNEITRLKLELYKIKNPSFILGSGPNGEVTEGDRRKAKSKALLNAKMAKLTGKPIDLEVQNLSEEQGKLDEEALRIQEENKKNQQIIRDVESSIKEISSNVMKSFTSHVDQEAYTKWELGVGVQPEVQELIKSFKLNDISSRFTRSLTLDTKQQQPEQQYLASAAQIPAYTPSPPTVSSPVSTPSPSLSSFKTPEDRKAYIREQAKKKMNERLAKFGINRSTSPRTSNISSPSSPKPQLNQSHPTELPSSQPGQQYIQQVASPAPAPVPAEESSDDDDEEEFQRMEEIRRLKRLERDQRLAQLNTEEAAPQADPQTTEEHKKFHDSNPFAFK